MAFPTDEAGVDQTDNEAATPNLHFTVPQVAKGNTLAP